MRQLRYRAARKLMNLAVRLEKHHRVSGAILGTGKWLLRKNLLVNPVGFALMGLPRGRSSDGELNHLLGLLDGLNDLPVFSILLPVYDPPPDILRRCLDSVQAQAYRHWQLCIVDDASPNEEVRSILSRVADQDKRILLQCSSRNEGIAATINKTSSISPRVPREEKPPWVRWLARTIAKT
jgi:hypothetical protein